MKSTARETLCRKHKCIGCDWIVGVISYTSHTALLPQMGKMEACLWTLVALSVLGIPAVHSAKCPKFCVCDAVTLAVACVNKNLTGVPLIDEVKRHKSYQISHYYQTLNFTNFKANIFMRTHGALVQQIGVFGMIDFAWLTLTSQQNKPTLFEFRSQ